MRIGIILFLTFLTLPCSAAQNAAQTVTLGHSTRMESRQLGTTHEINVSLPANYEKEQTVQFPVVYIIDGGVQQDFKHIAGLGTLPDSNPFVFQSAIYVGISTEQRLFELTAPNHDPRYAKPDSTLGGAVKFRQFITDQVIPSIESTYRTNGQRIIIGESLAGLFILETWLQQPELFTDYIAISPSLWYDDRHLAKQASTLLEAHADKPRRLYLTMASEGGTMQRGLDEVLDAIKQRGFDHLQVKYVDRSKTEHHWTVYHEAALDALRWTLPVPEPSWINEPDPWYLVEGANPPGWNTSNAPVSAPKGE